MPNLEFQGKFLQEDELGIKDLKIKPTEIFEK